MPYYKRYSKRERKRRRIVPNTVIELTKNLVITKAVEKRLRKKAEADIPHQKIEIIAKKVEHVLWAFLVITGYIMFLPLLLEYPLIALGIYLGIPIIVHLIIDAILSEPRKERNRKINSRVVELAEKRKQQIEEAEQFYSSPEWYLVRKQVIQENGKICAECHRKISRNDDVTVDHIKPRIRYPDLALTMNNLRVLCRSCNSRKGDREFTDIFGTS